MTAEPVVASLETFAPDAVGSLYRWYVLQTARQTSRALLPRNHALVACQTEQPQAWRPNAANHPHP